MIHILFAAYQVDRVSNGGMESATRIFEALADDFRWTLITNRYTPRTERWRAGGARIVQFNLEGNELWPLRKARMALSSCRSLTLGQGVDILHGNDIRGLQILAPLAQLSDKPFIFTLRDTKPECERYSPSWHLVARKLDALVTLSDDMSARVGERLPVPARLRHTINSIVDLEEFRPAVDRSALRAHLGIKPDEVALGMVAGIFDKKRQLNVITDVMPALADLPLRLHLIGDFNPDTNAYARACAKAAEGLPDRVVFHGFRRNVADWLAALDILVVASVREGLARCMIEAMACGTPVVSVDVSSAREMLETTGAGLVTQNDNWPAMSAAIRLLASNCSLRETMGNAGRQVAEARFSAVQVADQWRKLYASLANGMPKGTHFR